MRHCFFHAFPRRHPPGCSLPCWPRPV